MIEEWNLKEAVTWIALGLGFDVSEEMSGIDALLPFLERMREDGAIVLLKWDGERESTRPSYTVFLSLTFPPNQDSPLSHSTTRSASHPHSPFFSWRRDTRSLETALLELIIAYNQAVWNIVF